MTAKTPDTAPEEGMGDTTKRHPWQWRPVYTFEKAERRWLFFYWLMRYRDDALAADASKFESDAPVIKRVNPSLLRDYLGYVHRNALWYVVNRKKQEVLYSGYIVFSMALVVAIPVLCYLIPVWMASPPAWMGSPPDPAVTKEVASSAVITTQLSTILAGVIALHRLITSWLFRRNSALDYWRAGTELKNLHFDVVERWRSESERVEQVEADLRASISKARAVVAHETEAHFAAFGNLQVDLGQVLKSSAATSKKLIDDLSGSVLEEVEQKRAAEQAAADAIETVRVNVLTTGAELRTLKRQIKRAKTRERLHPDEAERAKLRTRIETLENTYDTRQRQQAVYEARYRALAGSP